MRGGRGMNWIQRALVRMAGSPADDAQRNGASSITDYGVAWSAAMSGAVKAWMDSWLTGGDTGASRSIVYHDTPAGRISAVKYNTWAGNCVSARAQSVASVPLRLLRRQDDSDDEPEIVDDHPVVELLRDVNPVNLDETSYREQVQRQKAIHGDCYTLKVRGGDGKPVEMYILPAHMVTCVSDPNGFIAGYKYGGRTYRVEDVIRDYYPDDYDMRLARSPTSLALEAVNRYRLADLSQEAIDMHGGQGGGIISFDFNQVAGDVERFKAEWEARRSDPRNAGRDAFLPPGASYESGVLTAQQQQREERSHRLIKEIMAAYGVPPSLAGDYSDASVLANAAQQSKNFWETWGIAECKHLAETLTYYLLWSEWEGSREDGLYLAPDLGVVPALADDLVTQAQREQVHIETIITKLQGGTISVNEAREEMGYDRIDDQRADDVLLLTVATARTTAGAEMVNQASDGAGDDAAAAADADAAAGAGAGAGEAMKAAQSRAMLVPFFDAVGRTAVLPDGSRGTVEAVKRFGLHGALTATTTDPVIVVDGQPHLARDVRLVIEV